MNTRPLFFLATLACSAPKTSYEGSEVSSLPGGENTANDDETENDDDASDQDDGPSDIEGPDDDEDTPDDDEDSPDDDEDAPDDDEDAPDDDEDAPDDDEDAPDDSPAPSADVALIGPSEVEATSSSLTTTGGSTIEYERFIPVTPTATGEVFIMHGFMRSKDQFTALAEHLASWGVTSTAMTMMHSSLVDIDPVENAADVVELAESLGAEEVVWIGHSNGGISALIASVMATEISAAVLGLDPVEAIGGVGAEWAPEVSVPVAALIGESDASCNSENSGLPTYISASALRTIRVTEADHCNFESPTNWLCTLTCGTTKTRFSDEAIATTITEMTTSWVLGNLLRDFDQTPWWSTGGSTWLELESVGALTSL